MKQRALVAPINAKIQDDLNKLGWKKLTAQEAMSFFQTVTMGRAGYFLPLAQITTTKLSKWDTQLRKLLRAKCGLPYNANANVFEASEPAGLGKCTLSTLAVAAGVTEMVTRLTSDGLLGAVARSRWRSLRAAFPTNSRLATATRSQLRGHSQGYFCRLAWRQGLDILTPEEAAREAVRGSKERNLLTFVDNTPCLLQHRGSVLISPFRYCSEVMSYVALKTNQGVHSMLQESQTV